MSYNIHERQKDNNVDYCMTNKNKNTTLSDDDIETMANHRTAKALGITLLSYPGAQHDTLVGAISEVAAEFNIDDVTTLVNDGRPYGLGYKPELDCLLVPESLSNILEPLELKALLAHELDHKSKKPVYDKIQSAITRLSSRDLKDRGATLDRVRKIYENITFYLETHADRSAMALYGAENLERAVIKTVGTHASPEFSEKHLSAVAAGTERTCSAEFNHRLRVMRGRQTRSGAAHPGHRTP